MPEPTKLVPGVFQGGCGGAALVLWDLLFKATSLFMGALTSRPNYYPKTPTSLNFLLEGQDLATETSVFDCIPSYLELS